MKEIAKRIHSTASFVAEELKALGFEQTNNLFFDTLKITLPEDVSQDSLRDNAEERGINLRYFDNGKVGISIDETTNDYRAQELLAVFAMTVGSSKEFLVKNLDDKVTIPQELLRTSEFLTHANFNSYHTETELMRYIKRLEKKDISLAHSMISLGSCTMKLNSASSLLPLGNPGLQRIHPYAPADQTQGYHEMIDELSAMLAEITGFAATSLQPNSGAAGEFTGLITIASYLKSIGEGHRKIALIPSSAHGTNPASAVQAGFIPKTVKCDENGIVDIDHLRSQAEKYK